MDTLDFSQQMEELRKQFKAARIELARMMCHNDPCDVETMNEPDLRTFEDHYPTGPTAFPDDTIARCVDTLIAEPFSMREDRAVEVARAVIKAALER